MWRNLDAVEAQQVGLEVAGPDRVNRATENGNDVLYPISATGELLRKELRDSLGCWGSVMEPPLGQVTVLGAR